MWARTFGSANQFALTALCGSAPPSILPSGRSLSRPDRPPVNGIVILPACSGDPCSDGMCERRFTLEYYRTTDGDQPVRRWIDHDLSAAQRNAVMAALKYLVGTEGVGICSSATPPETASSCSSAATTKAATPAPVGRSARSRSPADVSATIAGGTPEGSSGERLDIDQLWPKTHNHAEVMINDHVRRALPPGRR